MSWQWDAPSGTYRNFALSSNIREAASAMAQFQPFARPEQGYGKGRGASVTITRFSQLPLADRVSETERLPSGRPAISTKQQAVAEWGFKSELTNFEEVLTHFDLRKPIGRMLRDQLRLTMDKMLADAAKQTLVKFVPTGAGAGTFETVDPATTTALVNLDVGHIRLMRDYMYGDLKAPPYSNGEYVMIAATTACRGIRNDDDYKDWISQTSRSEFVTGELSKVENVRPIECNHFEALDNDIGSGSVLGEAVVFGDDFISMAVAQDPEVRIGMSEDLGRFREIGWCGIIEGVLIWDNATEARGIHITSA